MSTPTLNQPLPDALGLLQQMLDQAGLAGLGQMIWNEFTQGIPIDKIAQDVRNTDTYKQRFPAMVALQQKGMAITEAQYIDWERQMTQIAHAYGLPQGFYDTHAELGQFIAGGVSPQEFKDRVELEQTKVMNTDPNVRAQLGHLFGIGHGDLTAYFLDPTKALPALQQKVVAAETGAASTEAGFGQLSREQAMRLANMGVSQDRARTGFEQLAGLQVRQGLPGQQTVGTNVELGAEFGGNATDEAKLKAAVGQRRMAFGNQDVATTSAGAEGLRSAAV